jgi:accessory colonization factor AcfC
MVPGKPGIPVLHVYGPGGPAPAMKEAARAFSEKRQVAVEVTAGPTPVWKEQALKDADLIFSGSEYMMTDFVQRDLPGILKAEAVQTLYLRPSAILVRPGNRRTFTESGTSPSLASGCWWSKVRASLGYGRTWWDGLGMWHWSGLSGSRSFCTQPTARRLARVGWPIRLWMHGSFGTYGRRPARSWRTRVPTEPLMTVYRSCGAAVTTRTPEPALAAAFLAFLESADCRPIFAKWGWITAPVPQG